MTSRCTVYSLRQVEDTGKMKLCTTSVGRITGGLLHKVKNHCSRLLCTPKHGHTPLAFKWYTHHNIQWLLRLNAIMPVCSTVHLHPVILYTYMLSCLCAAYHICTQWFHTDECYHKCALNVTSATITMNSHLQLLCQSSVHVASSVSIVMSSYYILRIHYHVLFSHLNPVNSCCIFHSYTSLRQNH